MTIAELVAGFCDVGESSVTFVEYAAYLFEVCAGVSTSSVMFVESTLRLFDAGNVSTALNPRLRDVGRTSTSALINLDDLVVGASTLFSSTAGLSTGPCRSSTAASGKLTPSLTAAEDEHASVLPCRTGTTSVLRVVEETLRPLVLPEAFSMSVTREELWKSYDLE